jgi:adenosylcobinamide-GDP ribazoletransferase
MSGQWGRFVTALRFFTRLPAPTVAGAENLGPHAAVPFAPLVGILIGAIGAAAYWLAAQAWPTSVAVVLSMLATVLITGGMHERGFSRERPLDIAGMSPPAFGALGMLFALLIKYNALMALSAANLPFPLPEYLPLGVIMISGHAASRALAVSVIATQSQSSPRVSNGDLVLALAIGFAPATLLGIPGLMGLAAAIVMRLGVAAYTKRRFACASQSLLDAVQQLTEICFYLGALATRAYV